MIKKFSCYILEDLKIPKFRKSAEKKSSVAGGGYQAVRDIISGGKTDIDLQDYDLNIDSKLGKGKKQRKLAYDDLKLAIPIIADALGIKEGSIKFTGGGSYGIAFVSGDKVIKITADEWEARTAKYMMNHEYPNLIKYYAVKKIDNLDVYAILMDKVKKLSSNEHKMVDLIIEEYGSTITDFLENYENVDIGELDRLGYNRDYVYMLDQLALVFKQLQELGIMDDYADVHRDNLGWQNGKLIHYDIRGISEAPDVVEIIELNKKDA